MLVNYRSNISSQLCLLLVLQHTAGTKTSGKHGHSMVHPQSSNSGIIDDGQISEDPQCSDILANPTLIPCPCEGGFSEVPLSLHIYS